MTAASLEMMLVGAALVLFGVLGGALADRIRGLRTRSPRAGKGATARATTPVDPVLVGWPDHQQRMANDVIGVLVTSGFSRAQANEAAQACPPTTRSTIESWTRAALKQAAPKEMRS